MKRLIALLLLCLLTACAHAEPASERYTSALPDDCLPTALCALPANCPAEDVLIDLALTELAAQCDLGSDAMDDYTCRVTGVKLSSGEVVCAVSMFSQAYRPIDAVLLVQADGTVLRFESTAIGWFQQAQQHWQAVHGPFGLWPIEVQALFDELYYYEQTHALLPAGYLSEAQAIDLAIRAAGLNTSRQSLTYERALAFNSTAATDADKYVWMITLAIDNTTLAQVNLSAQDGHVIDMFVEGNSVG